MPSVDGKRPFRGLADASFRGNWKRELGGDQIAQARLIRTLLEKGVSLGQLAAADLAFDAGQKFLVFDGKQLRGYPDASSAFAAAARVKGRCGAVDLNAIRNSA